MPDETPTAPHARLQPSASYSFTMRLHLSQESGAFARVAQAIAVAEALLGAIDLVRVEPHEVVRAVTVMEGKAMLFKEFAGVDAFPLCLDTKDVDEIVTIVKGIAPPFGGINLEDISAPRCFEIERRLRAG